MTAGMIRVPSIMPLRIPSGGRKNVITTNTPIELRSETTDTIIYYTINGMKPEPFKQIGLKCTYRYNRPFVLGPGKRTVKAMATSSDGTRESSIGTRVFIVEEEEEVDEDEDDISEMGQSISSTRKLRQSSGGLISKILADSEGDNLRASKSKRGGAAWGSNRLHTSTPQGLNGTDGSEFRKPRDEPRFMSARFGSTTATMGIPDQSLSQIDGDLRQRPPENKVQASRIQQETDFLKCIYCHAPRPSDPFARFCNECGSPIPPLPTSRLPPPEGGQLGMCVSCHSMVPLNTPLCIVCEAPISPQRQPQATKKLASKLMCATCGTANPPDMKFCVTCESKLPLRAKQILSGTSAPPMPRDAMGSLITCSKCSRVNSSDARFCDWCGSKPALFQSPLVCSQCRASNSPFARFCNSCGCGIDPPPRVTQELSSSVIGTLVEKGSMHRMMGQSSSATWLPVSVPSTPVDKADKGTSTTGLFFPSGQKLQSTFEAELSVKGHLDASRDRRPALGAVSPGKGYWRQQMDHVCSHIRAHAQNNPDFRAIIGEPRLGKIITATVHEDLRGEEAVLTVTFARRDKQGMWKDESSGITAGLNSVKISKRDEQLGSADFNARNTRVKPKKQRRKAGKESGKQTGLREEDKLLIKELGAKGKGEVEEVEQLLSDGANALSETADGTPVIILATRNKHAECIPVLVTAGANVNAKTSSKGNTALHEAVLLGPAGLKCIDALLGQGAKAGLKNNAGQTPYDLAVSSGHDSIAQKFTSSVGEEMLQKLTKPQKVQYTEDDDDY